MSSLFVNTASIRVRPTITTPSASLNFRQIILQSPTSSSFFERDFDEIDLNDSSCTASISTVSHDEQNMELEAVSLAILSSLELYRSKGDGLSSLSKGSASIEQKSMTKKQHNRLSRAFTKAFSYYYDYRKSSPSKNVKVSTQCPVFDDGREDLIYHGMTVKEIKSTLNPMIVSTAFNLSLSDIKLQKPEYAHILSIIK